MLTSIFSILLGVAYLLGSVNSAIVVCKIWGLPSPRTVGSGNPGTTNVLRLGSKSAAACTLIGDALKAVIPVLIGQHCALPHALLCWVGLAAVIGHICPILYRFRGGKGVATTLGALLSIDPLLGGAFVMTWLVIAGLFRISSLAALVAIVLTPLYGWYLLGPATVLPLIILALLVLIRHHSNIRRLCTGQESRIGEKN